MIHSDSQSFAHIVKINLLVVYHLDREVFYLGADFSVRFSVLLIVLMGQGDPVSHLAETILDAHLKTYNDN